MFPFPLAYADTHDNPDSLWTLVLICCGLLVVVALVGLVPLLIARRRRNRYAEGIKIGCVIWAIAAAGFLLYAAFAHYRASTEYMTLIESGYYDPDNPAAAPHWPWPGAVVLALAYVPLLGASFASKGSAPLPGPPQLREEAPPPDFYKNN